jgi:hypothetical protein
MNKKRVLSLLQILILFVGTLGISYSLRSVDALQDYAPGPYNGVANLPSKPINVDNINKKGWELPFFRTEFLKSNFMKGLTSSALYGMLVWGGSKMLLGLTGMEENKVDALSLAAGIGTFAGRSTSLIWDKGFLGMGPKTSGLFTGIAVGIIVFALLYKNESTRKVTFTCGLWQAPTGGEHCEKCNNEIFPCSEYQCKSLGQSCELLNPGTDEEVCAWVNRNDLKFPIITPWEGALSIGYDYKPNNVVSPPDSGAKIVNIQKSRKSECVESFTPLSFGITLNEPGQCKMDYQRKESFDEMSHYFGGSNLFKYNHSQTMSLPGKEAAERENLTIYNDGTYDIYIRCQDANGNKNIANFVFRFCVEEGPDTTPPLIITTNVLNGMPISYNQTKLENFILYVNEPAECRWSKIDLDYENMENDMSCSKSITEMNAQMSYECKTTLTDLKSNKENKFYFRCKDQPGITEGDRNVNAQSYVFTLIGTKPLKIDSVKPEGKIEDSERVIPITLEAETSGGYNNGESTCYYSESCYKENGGYGEDDYIPFYYEEGSSSDYHSQDIEISEGNYECYIKCIDLGGNSDINKTEYTIETDTEGPIVVRIYYEENNLKLITNEKAECAYSNTNCNYLFEDGILMSNIEGTKHFADWNSSREYHIKCIDEYGNGPMYNQCSIVARPFDIQI